MAKATSGALEKLNFVKTAGICDICENLQNEKKFCYNKKLFIKNPKITQNLVKLTEEICSTFVLF
jgi:hypothetical protein